MEINRRGFLGLFGGGVVASATMAQAGVFSELLDFLRRKPVSVSAPATGWPVPPRFPDAGKGPRLFLSRDGVHFNEIYGIRDVCMHSEYVYTNLDAPRILDKYGRPLWPQVVGVSSKLTFDGMGRFDDRVLHNLFHTDLGHTHDFILKLPGGLSAKGKVGFTQATLRDEWRL